MNQTSSGNLTVGENNANESSTWLSSLEWQAVDAKAFNQLSATEQLIRIRHSSAHIMAAALTQLFPETEFATGPATPQGYFYDIKKAEPLKEEDLSSIQAEMDKIAGKSQPFEVASVSKADAIAYFKEKQQHYKLQVLERIPSETVTLYRNGNFVDLCAGPHVPHTGLCRSNKVLTLSAVHWRDEEKPSLTRITGTAWSRPKDLERYIEFLSEVKLRDHRTLGPQLDLFSFHPWAASALWHPHGVTLRNQLMAFWRETISEKDYIEILNPLLYKKELFETSGHWDHFQENMFIFRDAEGEADFALKPMNCPDTMLYFRSQLRSYRELPLRIAEGQILHRNEATGALHGIMRTRNFIQDDAHIFLAPEHVEAEVQALLEMLDRIYQIFQLNYNIKFSTRPESYLGSLEVWNKAEASLQAALKAAGKEFVIDEGEGAFYGPKIDINIQDSLGREWQCGTIQLDFQLPERFDLKYVKPDGTTERPIVVHRAIFGSFERFIGILIEHLGGAFPTWLAPVQGVVLPIAERHISHAESVVKQLKSLGFRFELASNESVNYRIRHAETQKIPYMLVIGDREMADNTVAVRKYTDGQKGTYPLTQLIEELSEHRDERIFDVVVKEFSSLFRGPSDVSTEDALY